MQFLEGSKSAITALAFAPDGNRLAIGGFDGSVRLVAPEPQLLGELAETSIHSLTFDSTGSTLFCAGWTGWFGFRDDGNGIWNVHLPKGTDSTSSLAFLDEEKLVIGTGDRTKPAAGMLEIRNIATGQKLEPRFREPFGVRAVATHGPSRTVAWLNGHNLVCIWNTQTLYPRRLSLPLQHAPSLAFHPDGEQIAIVQDYAVKVFDVKSLDERFALKGHTGRVTSVAYSPDGRTIATGSWDNTVRLWDSSGGTCRATFDWGITRILCLAFAPDGLRLAAGGGKGVLAICDVE